MKEAIELIIKEIHTRLSFQKEEIISLFAGQSGVTLFDIEYSKIFKNSLDDNLVNRLQDLGESAFYCTDSTICNGKSGINWLFAYLYNQGFLEREILKIICSDESLLALSAEKMIKIGNYDYLHGALGISYYLLYSPTFNDIFFFEKIFNALLEMKDRFDGIIPSWDSMKGRLEPGNSNLGLAHGLPSVLKFCIQAYNQGICIKKSSNLAKAIVSFLLEINSTNTNTLFSYYPHVYEQGNNKPFNSRLAWCYGDLSLAFILYQYGESFDDHACKTFALEILRKTTLRRTKDSTKVNDLGICHGSAGIAHIYNKLWHYTREEIFGEACDFWMRDIINEWKNPNGKFHKKFNAITGNYENCSNLLEGSAGVGLVLLSYLSEDFNWDYFLMLND